LRAPCGLQKAPETDPNEEEDDAMEEVDGVGAQTIQSIDEVSCKTNIGAGTIRLS
jgi:hypothetical protein